MVFNRHKLVVIKGKFAIKPSLLEGKFENYE